jgi:putative tryptophan/tyrosine transport system substrate-binding protein
VTRLAFLLIMLTAPLGAQMASERVYHLGELAPSASSLEFTRSVTLPELAKLGFIESRNLVVAERVGDAAAMQGLARELLLTKPDVIIAIGPDAIRAASEATSTVPIVNFGPGLVERGLAASLARPGGNITGVVILGPELDAKRLDLLHEALPTAYRVAALLLPSGPDRLSSEREMRAVAARTGIELLPFDASGPDDYPTAFAAMRAAGAQAVVIQANPIFYRDAARLAQLALETGLPTICEWAEMAKSGCLLGYGPNRAELRRRVAHYVDRIFRGAAPGELPIERPTNFEFAINLMTARALGITVPPSIMVRADEVIE